MKSIVLLACLGAVAMTAHAGSGDVYVPAHRSTDGTMIPANVPPSSGGTPPARKVKSRPTQPLPPAATPEATAPVMSPLFVAARPIRQ